LIQLMGVGRPGAAIWNVFGNSPERYLVSRGTFERLCHVATSFKN